MIHFSIRSLFFLLLFLGGSSSYAIDYYWVGGSGNWSDINHWATSSGGGLKHIVVPSPNDNVFFDHNSFTAVGQSVNIDLSIAAAKNFSVLNVQHAPVISGSTQLKVYGSMVLSRAMTWNFMGNVCFEAVNPGNSITTDSVVFLNHVYFQGIGGSWTLQDYFLVGGYIFLEYGSLNTNSKPVTCTGFLSTSSNVRSLTLGSSVMNFQATWSINLANLSFNAGQSKMYFSGGASFNTTGSGTALYHLVWFYASLVNSTINSNNANFKSVWFFGDGTILGNNDFDTLRLSPGKDYSISAISSIFKLFDARGDCVSTISISGGWTLTMNSVAQFLVDYLDVESVTASGGNGFVAHNSQDKGSNTGITFPPIAPVTLYWVGGSGQWHDTAHWSYTSGGPGGACIPTYRDDVWFDANSFSMKDSVEVFADSAACHDMRWVNIPDSVRLIKLADLYVYGSLWLHHNLGWEGEGAQLFFASNDPNETITSDSVVLNGPVYFSGVGGWTLQDDFRLEGALEHRSGTWNTNSMKVAVYVYHSSSGNPRTLTLGSSHFSVETTSVQGWTLMGFGYTLNAGTSTIEFPLPDAGMYNTSTFGFQFYHVIFSDTFGTAQLNTDNNYFHTLTFKGNGFIRGYNDIGTLNLSKGKDYKLGYNNVQTILTALNAIGGCDGYILIHSDEQDYVTNIAKASGVVNCEYLIVWNVHVSGGATFNANNSVDVGGNSGWNFTSPLSKNLYWVGGTGKWSDVNHWSLTSGGPGGACVPSPLDSVFFDVNSFLNPYDTVDIDLTNATCHTMTWRDTLMGAVMAGSVYNSLWLWGSIIFDTTMTNQFEGRYLFEAKDTGHIIVSANNYFLKDMVFEGRNGGWTVVDSLDAPANVVLKHGSLNASGKIVRIGALRSVLHSARKLNLSNANIEVSGTMDAWILRHDSLDFNATGSNIVFAGYGMINFYNYGLGTDTVFYHDVTFLRDLSTAVVQATNLHCSFNVATFNTHGHFDYHNIFDSLIFTPGHTYSFTGNTTQFFHYLSAPGTCFKPIVFQLLGTGVPQYYFHCLGTAAQVNYVTLSGCHGIGPATYTATGSVDLGGNANWTVTSVGPVDLYWVNGTGEWWNPNHWSYSSGGPGGACIPTHRDNVFFDQNSFLMATDTVFVDSTYAVCHNMEWITVVDTPTFILPLGTPLSIYGSLRFQSVIQGMIEGRVRFNSTHGGNFIYSGMQLFLDSITFNGVGGAWTLYDSLSADRYINLTTGNLNTNGQVVTAFGFVSTGNLPRQLTLDSSRVNLRSLWRMNGTQLAFNAGSSTITLLNGTSNFISENGNGFDYHNVHFAGNGGTSNLRCNSIPVKYNKVIIENDGIIMGEHEFDSLAFMPGRLYRLEKSKTQTINDFWLLRGNNCFPITLQSTQFGQQATVTQSAGQVVGDFLHVRDIKATGGAVFYAGDNSSDVSNNTGWTFNNSPSYIFGLGPDIYFTIGSTITISTANFNAGPGTTYQWSTGATTANITVSQPDTYSVTVTYAGNCVVVDTIIVYCDVDPIYTIGDCICYGDSTGWINVLVTDTVGTYTAVWSNGSTQLNATHLHSGTYIVTVYGSTGCNGKDTLQVGQPPPVVVPLGDTSFCEDSPGFLLDATSAFVNFWWDGQQGSQTYFVSQADTILVLVQDKDGCFSDEETIVVTVDTIPYIWLGEDAEICLGELLKLTPGPGFDEYLWQDGSNKTFFNATQGGEYHVTIKYRTCYNHDTIVLEDCPPIIRFPNVFTPNSDGYNDLFFPENQNIFNYRLVVYSRWGNVVFYSDDVNAQWDGTSHGVPCSEGTYYYTVEYEGFGSFSTKGRKLHHGVVTLLR